jgi:hypothetical protein
MALDWSNERYVRFYRRETPDQAAWCWQAIALWPWLLNKADDAGVIETTKGARGIAGLTRLPLDVVEPALAELVEDGCIVRTDTGYLIPNYIEAQTAKSSPNRRVADHRARSRAAEAADSVTGGNAVKRDVTRRNADDGSCNAELTPSQAKPSRAEDQSPPPARDPSAPPHHPDRVHAIGARMRTRVWDAGLLLAKQIGVTYQRGKPQDVLPKIHFAIAAWLAEGGEDLVVDRVETLIVFRSAKAVSLGHLKFWPEESWWEWTGITRDLGQPLAQASARVDGPDRSRRGGAIGRAPPATDHTRTDLEDPKDFLP